MSSSSYLDDELDSFDMNLLYGIALSNIALFCCCSRGEALIVVGVFMIAVAAGSLAAGCGLLNSMAYLCAGTVWATLGSLKIYWRNYQNAQDQKYSEAVVADEPDAIRRAKAILACTSMSTSEKEHELEKTLELEASKSTYNFEMVAEQLSHDNNDSSETEDVLSESENTTESMEEIELTSVARRCRIKEEPRLKKESKREDPQSAGRGSELEVV